MGNIVLEKTWLEDDPRLVRHIEVTTKLVQEVEKIILKDIRNKKELAELVGDSETTTFEISNDYLGITKVSARCVLKKNAGIFSYLFRLMQ